jgi:hypothetical protein
MAVATAVSRARVGRGRMVKMKIGRPSDRFPLLNDDETLATDRFISACTLPLVEELGSQVAVLGSGNLYEVCGRSFIVSAAHSFEPFDPERVGVLARTGPGSRAFLTLNGCRRYYWPDPILDVTVIEVRPGALLDALRSTYSFRGTSAVAPASKLFAQYVMVGYARAAAIMGSGTITPRVVKITSTSYEGRLPDDFDANRELLLNFSEHGWTDTGTKVETLPLQGLSGAAVWGIVPSTEIPGLWSPQRAMRVAGVQVACHPSYYIRCQRWWLVARMFEQIDKSIGAEFLRALS